jgi:hypothetical protein
MTELVERTLREVRELVAGSPARHVRLLAQLVRMPMPAEDVDAPAAGGALVLHDVQLAGRLDVGGAVGRRVRAVAAPPQPDVALARGGPAPFGDVEGSE